MKIELKLNQQTLVDEMQRKMEDAARSIATDLVKSYFRNNPSYEHHTGKLVYDKGPGTLFLEQELSDLISSDFIANKVDEYFKKHLDELVEKAVIKAVERATKKHAFGKVDAIKSALTQT